MSEHGKYDPQTLVRMFRMAAKLRQEMIEAGFTDNGGAIHSAERILDILGQRLNYPGLRHINSLRHYKRAIFSESAHTAYERGEIVHIEHVSPLRALTRIAIEQANSDKADEPLLALVRKHYRLVLLTPEETARLNKFNRSKMDRKRLALAGIRIHRAMRTRNAPPHS